MQNISKKANRGHWEQDVRTKIKQEMKQKMKQYAEIDYRGLDENCNYDELIGKVISKCFEIENLKKTKLYVSVILTTPKIIKEINSQFRDIDKETDVLSFPMFEKEEIHEVTEEEALGDIIISVERVKQQAEEYGHSFERELAYMLVHGFYHLMGEDHLEEYDKIIMRHKEENVLEKLNIAR